MKRKKAKYLRWLGKVLFVLYMGFLFYFLLISDWYGRTGVTGEYRYNLVLFKEINRFIQYRDTLGGFAVFANLFGNVLIFVPFGFFMPMASKNRSFLITLFYSFSVSLCVEIFQFFTKVGSFDVDDMLLNTIGGVLGYILFVICNAIRRYYANRKKKRR